MGAFAKLFMLPAAKAETVHAIRALDLPTEMNPALAALVDQMGEDLEDRGIKVDKERGPLNDRGTLSLIFASADIPSAVIRVGGLDNPPDSAIVLKHAARLEYGNTGLVENTSDYQVHILPFAPDNGRVTKRDAINTLRVLKTEGLLDNLVDIAAGPEALAGQFVYLKDDKGELLRYPSNSKDRGMAGRPIAFIRDLNSIQSNGEVITLSRCMSGYDGDAPAHIPGVHLDKLPPAPPDCVAACHQQDIIVEKLKAELVRKGVRLNAPAR